MEFVKQKFINFAVFLRGIKSLSEAPTLIELYANLFSGLDAERGILLMREHFVKDITDIDLFYTGLINFFRLKKLNKIQRDTMKLWAEYFLFITNK